SVTLPCIEPFALPCAITSCGEQTNIPKKARTGNIFQSPQNRTGRFLIVFPPEPIDMPLGGMPINVPTRRTRSPKSKQPLLRPVAHRLSSKFNTMNRSTSSSRFRCSGAQIFDGRVNTKETTPGCSCSISRNTLTGGVRINSKFKNNRSLNCVRGKNENEYVL